MKNRVPFHGGAGTIRVVGEDKKLMAAPGLPLVYQSVMRYLPRLDVYSLGTLRSILHLKLNGISFLEGLEAV